MGKNLRRSFAHPGVHRVDLRRPGFSKNDCSGTSTKAARARDAGNSGGCRRQCGVTLDKFGVPLHFFLPLERNLSASSLTGIFLKVRVRFVSDSSTANRSKLEAP